MNGHLALSLPTVSRCFVSDAIVSGNYGILSDAAQGQSILLEDWQSTKGFSFAVRVEYLTVKSL